MRILVGYLFFLAGALYATLPTNRCGFPIVAAGSISHSKLLTLAPHSHRYLTYFALEFRDKSRGFSAADYMASHITLKGVLEDQFNLPYVKAMAGGEIYLVNESNQAALGKIMIVNNTSSLMMDAQAWEIQRGLTLRHTNDPHLFLAALKDSGLEHLISDSVRVITDGTHILPTTPPHIRHRIAKHREWIKRAETEALVPDMVQWFTDLMWIDWYVRTEAKQPGTPGLTAASGRYLKGEVFHTDERAALTDDLDRLLRQVNASSEYLEIFPLAGAQ